MAEEEESETQETQLPFNEEELRRIAEATANSGLLPEEKQNVYKFLFAVATSDDTTKTGYLRDDKDLNEIGIPKHPIRTYKALALIADKIMNNRFFREYFEAESEIITSTSLSRHGKLIDLAVIQRREIADISRKPKGERKGWFKKKRPLSTEEALRPESAY